MINESLLSAAEQGNLERVRELLANGEKVDSADELGDTALCKAARNGHEEVINVLFQAGADINHSGAADMPPVMQAAVEGRVGIVKQLVSKGALVTRDLLGSIQLKVNILAENAEAGMVRPEAVTAWQGFLEELVGIYHEQNPDA